MPIEILVVDDDELQIDCVTQQIVLLGYTVRSARSGMEALESLKAHRVDMVITDYRMENMNGVQLRDRIRKEIGQIP